MKTSRKKKMTTILITAMLGVLVIGGTLAYMTTKTVEKVNNFTFKGDITATLTEPAWDAGVANDPNYGQNLIPGAEIMKDPIVTNTCDVDEYVALRVQFKDGDNNILSEEDFATLMDYITIDWNTTDWTLATSTTNSATHIYDYNSKLKGTTIDPRNATAPLFNKVTIKSTLTSEQIAWLRDTIGGFNIVVKGAAIQSEGFVDINAAKTELNGLLDVTPTP